ncbi:Transcriptional regulator [Seminavis robusta]|uniref:Transcriptional regulator n=1 Tax=Seminavis robusta TaxID=568900 RepID=A0A9N8HRC2_9STRA|nr:Transcriptional regulator [Seminavis robusta]|eukprot:Sro1302_g260900.1 Transcriptional regulator (1307) ;mRNA; f:15521-19949
MSDWPLQNICEPHESNDVLLKKKTKGIVAHYFSPAEAEQDNGQCYEGNLRFLELLKERHGDYVSKSPMEKPLVALELLRQWRTQVPPGRFLMAQSTAEDSNAPPLWKDVGDKEARSRISKALKQLSSSRESSSGSQADDETKSEAPTVDSATVATATPTASATSSLEDKEQCCGGDQDTNNPGTTAESSAPLTMERQESDRPVPRSVPRSLPAPLRMPAPSHKANLPPIPRIVKPSRLASRRISAQLHAGNVQGRVYGRWKERDQLLGILKRQMKQKPQRPPSLARCGRRTSSSLSETSGSVTNNTKVQERKVDFVLIQGSLGVGKTALARTLKNPMALTDDDDQQPDLNVKPSFFLEAKFEQLMNPNPYQCFLDVFNDFCRQLIRCDDHLIVEQCREAIMDSFQEDVDVLLNLIPALGHVVFPECHDAKRPGTLESKSSNSSGALMTQKVKGYFVLLLQTIASLAPQNPLVVLLNDLHWASEISLDILTTLIADVGVPSSNSCGSSSGGIIFVASLCDDQEAKPYFKPAMEVLASRRTVDLHTITLQNMTECDVRDFLVDTLDCGYEKVLELSKMMYRISKGNPMLLQEFLRKMQDHGFLRTDETTGEWTFDMSSMSCHFSQAESFSDMLRLKISRFSKEAQKTLKYAACLGSSTIDMSLLTLMDPENVASHLSEATEVGLLRNRDDSYHFSIDGVQHKIYSMIPSEERASYHLCIAQKLWKHLEERKDKEFLFILLNQLMLGDSEVKADDDRRAVAGLCLRAGELAAKTLGFHTAWVYLEHGISILPKDKLWGRDNYDLSLRLHNAAVEVCYCNAQFQILDDLIEAILEHSRVFDDSLIARSTKIFALGSRHHLAEALDVALSTLKELGERLPSDPTSLSVATSVRKTKKLLHGLSDESILRMKRMTDRNALAKMSILNHMFLYAFYAKPYLGVLVSLRMVQLTMEYGISGLSSVAFCFYAELLVCGPSVEDGIRYGKLGMQLYEKCKNEAWLCRVWGVYYGLVSPTREALAKSLEPLRHAKRVGMRTGDMEYAMLNGMIYIYHAGHSLRLPELKEEIRKLTTEMEQTGHTLALASILPVTQCISRFEEGMGDEQQHQASVEAFEVESRKFQANSNQAAVLWLQYSRMSPAYMYGEFDQALKYSKGIDALYTKHGYNSTGAGLVLFVECMVLLAHAKKSAFNRLRYVPYVKRRLRKLKKWTYLAPDNLQDKLCLLKAELAAVLGDLDNACLHSRSGILHARSHGHLGIEAMGNERLAMYILEKGDSDAALLVFDEACRVYDDWGATAKAVQLRKYRESLLGVSG